MNRKEQRALAIIRSHIGKERVYEFYKKTNPSLADQYLSFIGRNPDAQYIRWNTDKDEFSM